MKSTGGSGPIISIWGRADSWSTQRGPNSRTHAHSLVPMLVGFCSGTIPGLSRIKHIHNIPKYLIISRHFSVGFLWVASDYNLQGLQIKIEETLNRYARETKRDFVNRSSASLRDYPSWKHQWELILRSFPDGQHFSLPYSVQTDSAVRGSFSCWTQYWCLMAVVLTAAARLQTTPSVPANIRLWSVKMSRASVVMWSRHQGVPHKSRDRCLVPSNRITASTPDLQQPKHHQPCVSASFSRITRTTQCVQCSRHETLQYLFCSIFEVASSSVTLRHR
jgi:hypothetical protein